MAKTNTLHIRVEPKVKQKAEETLNDLGLSMAEAINVFLNQVILHDGIPFEIKKPRYTKDMIEAIAEADKMLKNPDEYKSFDSVDELMEDLNSDE